MNVMWGIVVVLLSLLSWGGQALSWFAPTLAERWNLTEAEADVERRSGQMVAARRSGTRSRCGRWLWRGSC